ncbi:MAG: hypothetical protein ABIO80_07400 [Sphingomicrobium sp.]
MKRTIIGALTLVLAACGTKQQANTDRAVQAPEVAQAPAAPASPEAPAAPAGPAGPQVPQAPQPPAPKDRKILIEPRGPIDPKSVEAAGQVVQLYGALVEEGRSSAAERLWGDRALARRFKRDLDSKLREIHLEIGELGDTDGAAGSIYTTMPVVFYGRSASGKPLRLPRSIILRRVNDVPGSTAAQRRWHIERIELKPD